MISDRIRAAAAILLFAAAAVSCGKQLNLPAGTPTAAVMLAQDEEGYTTDGSEGEEAAEATAAPEPETEPPTEPFSVDLTKPEGHEIAKSHVIEGFETVMQNPELPTGCEITALDEVLRFLGFDIDKVELADEFMPLDFNGAVTMSQAFLGEPKSVNGYGCSSPVIVYTADEYFESVNSPCYAVDLTGTELKDLFYQLEQGRPLVVWVTMNLRVAYPTYRFTAQNGEEMWFDDLQHCIAIYGYDLEKNTVHAADPLVGNIEYDMGKFQTVYDIMGKQAVVICGDASTEGDYTPRDNKPETPILSRNKQAAKAAEEASKAAAEEASRIAAEEASKAEAEEASRAAAEEASKAEAEEASRAAAEEASKAEAEEASRAAAEEASKAEAEEASRAAAEEASKAAATEAAKKTGS